MEKREFKIGDKVVRVKDNHMGMYEGDIGTIKELDYFDSKLIGFMFEEFEGKHSIKNFRLVEEKVEEKEMNTIDKINNFMNDIFKVDINSEIKETEYRIKNEEEHIQNGINHINNHYKKLKEYMLKLKSLKENTQERDFTSEIQNILGHKVVEDVKIDTINGLLDIYTDYIDIYDEDGNKFKGNKYRLEFNYKDMRCKIYGLDKDYCRRGYWTSEDPHPHVSGETANACWGDAGSMLTMNMNEGELYASFIVVLNFLQQVNTNDVAGEHIGNWDCIDEDGYDIDNPYEEIEYEKCSYCDCDISDDDVTHCECGATVCEDHNYWVESTQEYICQNCFDESYVYCYKCDEIYHVDDTTYIDGEHYCEGCRGEIFKQCDECEEWKPKEDTFVCDGCYTCYCDDCSTYKDGYCTDCYEEEEEEEEGVEA